MPDPAANGGSEEAEVTSISNGNAHSAALLGNGLVLIWGRGEDGQLGLGNAEEQWAPTSVSTIADAGISSVACGAEYTIALSQDRTQVWSWGWGDFGRLGHGDCLDVFIPRPISAFAGVRIVRVAAGDTHSLAVTAEGEELYSFGRNANGQLGIGTSADSPSPVLVSALKGQRVVSIAAGAEHSVAALESGEVYAWGWGRYGNVGDGQRTDRWLPTAAKGLEGRKVLTVACGWRHSLAADSEGCLYTWGWGAYGQLGLDTNTDVLQPTLVSGVLAGNHVRCVAGGWRHSTAVDSEGRLYSWGWNKFGQLGLGKVGDQMLPVRVLSLAADPVRLVACGWRHTTVVSESGKFYSWGRGCCGQLGHGGTEDLCEPKLLEVVSKGTVDVAALTSASVEATDYVPPADRYAVVPGAAPNADSLEVPQVPDVKRQKCD